MLNSLSAAVRAVQKMKEEKESAELTEVNELLSKSITQQFALLHRVRKFMDTVGSGEEDDV